MKSVTFRHVFLTLLALTVFAARSLAQLPAVQHEAMRS
jgi:hypothetical protein